MRRRVHVGLIAPLVLGVSVFVASSCGRDQTPTGVEAGPQIVRATPGAPLQQKLRPAFAAFTQGGDSSSEGCQGGETCIIQGQTIHQEWYMECTGSCASSWTWFLNGLPSGVSATFNPTSTATNQHTQLDVKADSKATTTAATATLGASPSPNTASWPVHILCSYNHNHCPAVEIVDLDNSDAVVSSPPASTGLRVIGQRMHLLARVKSGTGSGPFHIDHTEWTMTGDSLVQAYDFFSGHLDWFDPSSFNDVDSVTFFYSVQQNSRSVRVKATVSTPTGDVHTEAEATFDVDGPTNVSMTSLTLRAGVTASPYTGTTSPIYIRFGEYIYHDSTGISWTFQATQPAGVSGRLVGTQIIWGEVAGAPVTGDVYNVSEFMDGCPFYWTPSTTNVWLQSDSPRAPVTAVDTLYGQVNIFQDFLMYRPDGPGNIWVPVGTLWWDEGGIAVKDSTQPSGWRMINEIHAVDPTGMASSQFPRWSYTLLADPACTDLT